MSTPWILTVAAAWWIERKLIYKPARYVLQTPANADVEHEEVTFHSADGAMLNGWWIPRAGARGTILYCHGNKGSMGDRVWIARDLSRLPFNVFMFDYRGYGLSDGIPTVHGTRRDVIAAWDHVRSRHGDGDNPPVALYGSSLGAAIAAQLLPERPVRCLILEGGFTSTLEMGRRFYPWILPRITCVNRYDTLSLLREFDRPLLVSHSREDAVIPFDMGRALFDASPSPKKQFFELSGVHGEFPWRRSPGYWETVAAFLDENMPQG
ncbi:MAG: alpha/beta fold hydrolase [Kiritimatiellia bacterium]